MKVDLSPQAVTGRLRQVEALRRLCLSLARAGVAREVARKHTDIQRVTRTVTALGDTREHVCSSVRLVLSQLAVTSREQSTSLKNSSRKGICHVL